MPAVVAPPESGSRRFENCIEESSAASGRNLSRRFLV